MKSEISIPSDFSYLKKVEDFIHGVLEDVRASDLIYGSIILCVNESVNNAICHGNKQDLNKHVTIFAECIGEYLIIEVADEGNGFNFEDLPDPTKTENLRKEGGRGLFIIKYLVDQITFKNNGSIIQLKFKLDREHQFLYRRHFRSSAG